MSSLLIPLSLLVAGTVFTAGHAAFKHVAAEAAAWRYLLRVSVYLGLITVLSSTEDIVGTALWLGLLPSLGLASHVWFYCCDREAGSVQSAIGRSRQSTVGQLAGGGSSQ